MSRIIWGLPSDRIFAQGVDRGVFYPKSAPGVPWSGLLGIKEGSDGDVKTEVHVDGVKTLNKSGSGAFSATAECFTYPDELETEKIFDFAYRTYLGGYQLHLVYDASTKMADIEHSTIKATPELSTFSWFMTTRPVLFHDRYRMSHLVIDYRRTNHQVLKELESILYGTDDTPPRMPTPDEVFDIYQRQSILRITVSDDGVVTFEGPEEAIHWLDTTRIELRWPTITWLDDSTFSISST